MSKIIKIDSTVIVTLDSGQVFQKSDVTDAEFNIICNASEDELLGIFCPEVKEVTEQIKEVQEIEDRVRKSNLLTWEDNTIYFPLVSKLSVPKELAESILDAEENNDSIKIETYKNFWTLLCLNPDEDCRNNLWWFLNRYEFVIAKCGFFVAYRNVDKTSTEGIYTDHHSHTFRIKIGEMVTLDRSACDTNSHHECSNGLHLASPNWLNINYYGTVGLACLCNPADVCAVPRNSEYGKLRTCAYLPIDKIEYNTNGKVIPYPKETGFECDLVPQVIYEGIMGTESNSTYKFDIPTIPGVTKDTITDRLLEIAKNVIIERNILQDEQES